MSCAAVFVIAVSAALVVLVPVTGRDSDWAGIYAMRWSALTAIFTALSALAIGLTAIYARQTIALTRRTERVKQTLNLIAAYQRDGARDAFNRYCNKAAVPQYTTLRQQSDLGLVVAYFEDVALQLDAQIVDRDLLMRQLAFTVTATWEKLFTAAGTGAQPVLTAEDYPAFTALKCQAAEWSAQR